MAANPEKNIDYNAQHMNDPEAATELTNFDTSWLKFYRWEERDGKKVIVCKDDKEEFVLGTFLTYGFIDPGGFSDKRLTKTGSRFAILCGGQPPGSHKKFVTWAWAGRFKDPDKILDQVFLANTEIRPHLWRQEVFAQQRYILEDIKREAKARRSMLRIVELESDETKDAKALRVDALKAPMFNGEIYVHESMKDLINEIQVYPNGLTVDLIDLLAQLNQTYWKRGQKYPVAEPKKIGEYRQYLSAGTQSRTGY